jgi:hypothetical protein
MPGGTTGSPYSWEMQIRGTVSPVVGVPDVAAIHGIWPCETLTCAWLHCKPHIRPPVRAGAAHEQEIQQLSLHETQNQVICPKLGPTPRPAFRPTVGGNATATQTRESTPPPLPCESQEATKKGSSSRGTAGPPRSWETQTRGPDPPGCGCLKWDCKMWSRVLRD